MHFRRLTALLLCANLAALAAGCSDSQPPPLQQVRLQLDRYDQAQFAGFYLAADRGIYRDAGIAVTMARGGSDVDAIERVASGAAQFGVARPEQLIAARAAGRPVVAIAVIFQRSPLVFMVHPGIEVRGPEDFAGHSIAFTGLEGRLQFESMMASADADPDAVTRVPFDYTYESLRRGEVDIQLARVNGGYLWVRRRGFDPEVIWPDRFGVHFYGDVLITRDAIMRDQPGLATRFVRATLAGWEAALTAPEAAIESTLRRARQSDPALQYEILRASAPLIDTGDTPLGAMDPAKWRGMAEALARIGEIENDFDASTAFDRSVMRQLAPGF